MGSVSRPSVDALCAGALSLWRRAAESDDLHHVRRMLDEALQMEQAQPSPSPAGLARLHEAIAQLHGEIGDDDAAALHEAWAACSLAPEVNASATNRLNT